MNDFMDAEYQQIRDVMNSRGRNADKLPGKVVRYIPEERADRVLALDERIQKMKLFAPAAGILLAFVIGLLL